LDTTDCTLPHCFQRGVIKLPRVVLSHARHESYSLRPVNKKAYLLMCRLITTDRRSENSGDEDNSRGSHGRGIDKALLALREPRRDKAHLKFVATQACLICGRQPSDPHHLGFAQPRALGRKVIDEFTVPLCRAHHREVHRSGNEQEWWKPDNLDPHTVASAPWLKSLASFCQITW
jgi:hypothetical protein